MNTWQIVQQLKYALQRVTWPGGSQDAVFGSAGVYVTAGPMTSEQHPTAFPFALISVEGGAPDAEDPGLIEQQITVVTAVRVRGDGMGEFAVIGGARGDIGKSAGAGATEVAARVRTAIETLTRYDGGAMLVSGTGTTAPSKLEGQEHIAYDSFAVTALCTSDEHYTAPQTLKRSGGDIWTWDADSASNRFDFKEFDFGYVTGDEPVSSPLDASWNSLETTTYGMSSQTYTPGRVYQVFATYNPRSTSATATHYSAPERGSYLVT